MFELLVWASKEVFRMPEAIKKVQPWEEDKHCEMLATMIFDRAMTQYKKEKMLAEACGIES